MCLWSSVGDAAFLKVVVNLVGVIEAATEERVLIMSEAFFV